MRYTVEFTASALREFRALGRQLQRRMAPKISQLADDPLPPGIKKLRGAPDHYRLRIGDYRIIYRLDAGRVVVVIVKIGHRRDVYR